MKDTDADAAVLELDPDDIGTGKVHDNGMLYVGREHAGDVVRWLIEQHDD